MLEPIRLVVDVVHVDPERLGEVELEQPVMADHLEGPCSPRGERHPAVGRVLRRPSAASFFTIALADAAETCWRRASAEVETRSDSMPSL